jgi:hypothetical protein
VTERGRAIYVTQPAGEWVAIDLPFGLVPPPILELHKPMAGPVPFYHAEGYRLPIPKQALPVAVED